MLRLFTNTVFAFGPWDEIDTEPNSWLDFMVGVHLENFRYYRMKKLLQDLVQNLFLLSLLMTQFVFFYIFLNFC